VGVPAKKVRLLIDEFDFSTDTGGVTVQLTDEALDGTGLQMEGALYVPGFPAGNVEHKGFYTGPQVGRLEAELDARLGSDDPVTVAVLLDTRRVGNPAYVLEGTWGEQLTPEAPIKNLITLNGKWAAMPVRRGLVLLDGPVTATGAGTVVDFSAAQPVGVAGARLFVLLRTVTGAMEDAALLVECDAAADMGSPTTLGTVTLDGVGVYAAEFAGAVERYVRVRVTSLGGATAFAVACVLCVDGVTG
jgi:hypothetical protein